MKIYTKDIFDKLKYKINYGILFYNKFNRYNIHYYLKINDSQISIAFNNYFYNNIFSIIGWIFCNGKFLNDDNSRQIICFYEEEILISTIYNKLYSIDSYISYFYSKLFDTKFLFDFKIILESLQCEIDRVKANKNEYENNI